MNQSKHKKFVVGRYYYSKYWKSEDPCTISTWVYLGPVEIDPSVPESEQFLKHRFRLQLREDVGGAPDDFVIEIYDDDLKNYMNTEEELLKYLVSSQITEARRKQQEAAFKIPTEVEPDAVKEHYSSHAGRQYLYFNLHSSNDLRTSLTSQKPVDLYLAYPLSTHDIELLASFTHNLGLSIGTRTGVNAFELQPLFGKENLRVLLLIVSKLPQPQNEFLEWLESLTGLEKLSLIGPKFTDEMGDSLRNLPQLKALEVRYSKITAEILFSLQACSSLITLNLSDNPRLTDRSFEIEHPWPLLSELSLGKTSISDRAVKMLQQLPQLSSLNLENTKITEQSLPILKQMTQLTSLNIRGTDISLQGALDLIHSLKDCQVLC